jgi:hypothetical protein
MHRQRPARRGSQRHDQRGFGGGKRTVGVSIPVCGRTSNATNHWTGRAGLRILRPNGRVLFNSFRPALPLERLLTLEGIRTSGLHRQLVWAKQFFDGVFDTELKTDGHYYSPRRGLLAKFLAIKGFRTIIGPDQFHRELKPARLTYQHKGFVEYHDWYLLEKAAVSCRK